MNTKYTVVLNEEQHSTLKNQSHLEKCLLYNA